LTNPLYCELPVLSPDGRFLLFQAQYTYLFYLARPALEHELFGLDFFVFFFTAKRKAMDSPVIPSMLFMPQIIRFIATA